MKYQLRLQPSTTHPDALDDVIHLGYGPGSMKETEFFISGNLPGEPVHIRLQSATLRVRDRFLLAGTDWEIGPGENWVVMGPNGAGKSSLAGALVGTVPVVRGSIFRSWNPARENPVGYVSFDQQRRIAAREDIRKEARFFSAKLHEETTVRDLLCETAAPGSRDSAIIDQAACLMGVDKFLDVGAGRLSNGEMRKVMIARALMLRPRLLVLDEPFDGLDKTARDDLRRGLHQLLSLGMQMVLVTHRLEDIPSGFSKCLEVRENKVKVVPWSGGDSSTEPGSETRIHQSRSVLSEPGGREPDSSDALVEFRDVTVRYLEKIVLGRLNWIFLPGENWAVTGPNGAGKTTLLRLITADTEQAYANEIYLFGKRRGTGESIWDIKRPIGILGADLHLLYRNSIKVTDAVVSGFYDSIGLFRTADREKLAEAGNWLKRLGLDHLADRMFDRLSFGEQRLVLMARAMVKSPRLLILDEPCQGLDPDNRRLVLELADSIGRSESTRLLFVTHYEAEIPSSVNRELRIEKPVGGLTPAAVFSR